MELTRLIGRRVVDATGAAIGRVDDVGVGTGVDHPVVAGILVRHRRRSAGWVAWADIGELDEDHVTLVRQPLAPPPADAVLLARDVLDVQIYDVAGRRLARVGDVRLVRRATTLVVAGVEVGMHPVLRRIGLGFLVPPGRVDAPVDWASVRIVSGSAHALRTLTEPVHRLGPADLAALLARLPAARGADVLERLPPPDAAAAISHTRPRVAAGLVGSVRPASAATIIGEMPRDDAASTLRHLPARALDELLARVDTSRATELRRLIAHPPSTAAGLMNPEIVTVERGATASDIQAALNRSPPRLDALLTVFVVDGERYVGAVTPRAVLAGDAEPSVVPTVRPDAPIGEVIDLFALHDLLALPVVDASDRLVGAVAVDDILEEVLAERLPGRRRYRTAWRRP